MTADEKRIIQLLLKFARPKILKYFRPDSCIAATKVAIDVLEHFHITAFPQTVKLFVANWRLMQRLTAGTWHPGDPFGPNEWSVGIGYGFDRPLDSKAFDGHLVAVIADQPNNCADSEAWDEWLIDLSLDQAARPHKDIDLEPSLFRCDDDWRAGHALVIERPKWVLRYERLERDWQMAPDWNDSNGLIAPIVRNVISLIQKRL